jgi:MoaA/NifB/PqqE/SkfB family radical SAM enzyme
MGGKVMSTRAKEAAKRAARRLGAAMVADYAPAVCNTAVLTEQVVSDVEAIRSAIRPDDGGWRLVPRDPGHHWAILQMPLTDLCNLRCRHCTRRPSSKLFGVVPLETFTRRLSRFLPRWFEKLYLSDWGETMIIPNVLEYFYAAKRAGWDRVEFTTSDSQFDKHAAVWEELIVERLTSKVSISIESTDRATYESIRGVPYESFRKLVAGIAALRQKHSSPLRTELAVTCFKDNIREVPKLVQLASDVGVDWVETHYLSTVLFVEEADKLCVPEQSISHVDRKEILDIFAHAIALAREKGIRLSLPEPFPELEGSQGCFPDDNAPGYRCALPFQWVHVWFDGQVFPCCSMAHEFPLGSVDKLDFHSIWNNLRYKRVIEGLAPGGDPIDACKRCSKLL